jgi:murein DD-endopeptidase MepM/ murein hydrolase activator NlpD
LPLPHRFAVVASVVVLSLATAHVGSAAGSWSWPVAGPVIEPFDPPTSPYGTGHRGIDIATRTGTAVRAPAPGVVAFAGPVGGSLFVTLDHGGGVQSTYSWLSAVGVGRGDVVGEGTVLASSGPGHPGVTPAHLHFGVRRDDVYVDPLGFLSPGSVVGLIRLAPLAGP